MNGRLALKIITLILIIILATYLFIHFNLYPYFTQKDKAVGFINSFHPYDALVFILLQILQVVAAPIPGEATGFIGGYLYGPFLGTIYSTIGLTIGSWLAFVLAKMFGLPLVERTVKSDIFRKYDYVMEHQGGLISFVLFLIPGFPKDYLCYIMGLSHMRTWTFLVISTIGRLLGTILLTITGSCARNNQYVPLVIVIALSGIFLLLAYLNRDKWIEVLKGSAKKTT